VQQVAAAAPYTDSTMPMGSGFATPTKPVDLSDDDFNSSLADALATSVDRRDTSGPGKLKRGREADLPTFDYASATPEEAPAAGQEPTLPAPGPIPNKTLADLFQVATIGGADKKSALPTVDYGYGQALPQRRRREA
jgi:hypothetical protein